MSTRNQRKYALNHLAAVDRIDELESTLNRVRRLHRPHESPFSHKEKCLHCGYVWPCPTTVAAAVSGEAEKP